MLNRKGILWLVAGLLAALLLSAACGGGDDDDSSGDDTSPTVTREGGSSDDATQEPTEDSGDASQTDEPTEEPSEGSGGNACDLLSSSDIEQAFGESYDDGAENDYEPFLTCTWTSETFNNVTVTLYHDDASSVEFYYELTQDAQEIDGIGERAQWSDTGSFEFLVDDETDVTLSIFNTDLDDAAQLAAAKELAQKILDEL